MINHAGIFVHLRGLHSLITCQILYWHLLVAYFSKLAVLELLPDFFNFSTAAHEGVAFMKNRVHFRDQLKNSPHSGE